MSVISRKTKGKAGIKIARAAAKRPQFLVTGTKIILPVGKAGLRATKPLLTRRARKRLDRIDRTARKLGETLAVAGPKAAYELGIADPPRPKRTVPRIAAGFVLGASSSYFLAPGSGAEHRRRVAELVS